MVDTTMQTYLRPPNPLDGALPVTDPYAAYAAVYDVQGQSRWSERMVAFLGDLLPRYDAVPRRVLDLACGTGTAALRFAAQGYAVTAIDGSAPMLEVARQKAAQEGATISFSQQDMRAFTTPEPVDLLTCFYDSLNYLTDPADLARTFSCMRAALAPDGLAVFDMNTRAGLAADWNGACWVQEIGETYFIQQAEWDAVTAIATMTLTCFVRLGHEYRRFEEVHTERGYTLDEITAALTSAGLTVLDAFACLTRLGPTFEPPGETTGRIVLVARP
ncbi:MAG: class I SAM-dependent methyltransferase [Thermomicrobia bacterium]|nr:class I SAM-dependent methyltransferase [Thermomicrobia bacterium]